MDTVDRSAWRAQVIEVAIEADLPIVDAHHHIWPKPPSPGFEPWGLEAARRYKARSGHNIVATIFCEAHVGYRHDGPEHLAVLGETEFVDAVGEQADSEGLPMSGLCAGIVAKADMMLGAQVAEVLDGHRDISPKRFRGVRFITACDPDMIMPQGFETQPGLMTHPAFLAAFEKLAERGLVFDAFLPHPQLGEVAALADRFPDTRIVINHSGGPMGIGRFADGSGFSGWRDGLAACAERPNIFLKLGGLNMWITGLSSPDAPRPRTSSEMAEAHGRHLLTAIEIFGADRCMFETNFPVDLMHLDGTVLWNGFKKVTADLDANARRDLFFSTASRVYNIAVNN